MGRNEFWCRATDEERTATRPGDDAFPHPILVADHAIDIAAPPEAVWPWLLQMGAGRAGWYSYDWIDNFGKPSAKKLLAGLPQLKVGSVMPVLPSATDAFIVTEIEEPRYLVLSVSGRDGVLGEIGSEPWRLSFNRANWSFWLASKDKGTRLSVRARCNALRIGRLKVPSWPIRLFGGLGHDIMQRKQLYEIRKRAER